MNRFKYKLHIKSNNKTYINTVHLTVNRLISKKCNCSTSEKNDQKYNVFHLYLKNLPNKLI